jgi:2,3-bisphosphoglycerate-dependent phosphoglycerate mutase
MPIEFDQNNYPYHITLLRHAQSVGNLEKYHQGQVDFPLTEQGERQAEALAQRWLNEGRQFDLAITSTLARASRTAEIITQKLNIPLQTNPIWMERDNGALGGLKFEESEILHPHTDFLHLYQPIGETGESQWELYLRAGRAIQSLINQPPGRYLVISHGAILNMVLYTILGIPPQANFQGARFRFRNTAFATFLFRPTTHNWVMIGLNDRRHWEDFSNLSENE